MEILEAFDLTGSLRGAAELVGCDHKTVAHWVRARDEAGGGLPVAVRPRPRVDAFAEKIEEWVDRSRGKVRADVAHQRLVAMGYLGSERTTRRAVAAAKRRWRAEHGRRTRPWMPEPGLWMQWDYGDGPEVAGRSTVLFCAWLAWSRFRVVLPLWDRTMPSVVMALDRALRAFGGAPTYALTDNEKTVSVDHVCGMAVRNPQIVSVGRHYGLTIATCVPADPQSKGGSEATVRIARADLVPTEHNLRGDYEDFARARAGVRGVLRSRQRARAPDHAAGAGGDAGRGARAAAPAAGGAAHGLLRPDAQGVLAVDDLASAARSTRSRSTLVDERVWARADGDELVIVHADAPDGPREVARHRLTTPGRPSIRDEHYPPRPAGALERTPASAAAPRSGRSWRSGRRGAVADRRGRGRRRPSCGASSPRPSRSPSCTAPRTSMRRSRVAADAGRFGEGDLAAILAHRGAQVIEFPARASEQASLQRSTRSWEGFGA